MRRVALGTTARRGWLALLGALVVLAVALPATANAGQVVVNLNARGAGLIIPTVSGACDATTNLDDRTTIPCGTAFAPFVPNLVWFVNLTPVPLPVPAGHWQFVGWTGDCTAISGNVCQVVGVANQTVTANVTARFEDILGPTVTPNGVTYSTTTDRTVTFPTPGTNEPASFECSIDSGAFVPCTNTTPFTLAEGNHDVRFRGVDRSGNAGSSTAPQNFTVVDTTLLSGPADFSPSNDGAFVVGTATGVSVECAFDGAPLANCGTTSGDQLTVPFTDLPDGAHTFTARARFDGDDFDRVALTRTWTVDTEAPDTSFDPAIGPRDGDVTTLFTATFGIGASADTASLQCRLGSGAFAACSSPHSFADLPFGQHRFEARAIDRAGNVDATPAGRTWTIVAVDIDGDGFNQRSDCNENDPRINPSAREIRGNAVDENCDRVAAETTRMRVTLSHAFKAFARHTTFSKFQIRGLPNRATVRVACKVGRKKCPAKARKSLSKRNASGNLNLKSRYVGIRLKPKTTITVTVTAPEFQRFIKTIKVRAGKIPLITDRCVPQGARRPQRCR
jgi:Putative metal-binding motif